MKHMRKLMALLLVAVMVMAMGVTAMADEPTTGTITVTNATKGITYKAYKVFDATFVAGETSKVSYTVPSAYKDKIDTSIFDVSAVADAIGNYTVSKKDSATDAQVIKWVQENYADMGGTAIVGTFDTSNSTVTFSNLPFGYYYITSSLGATVTIDTTNPTASVKDKNDATPEAPIKKITGENETDFNDVKTANEAGVGSTEDFTVTFNAVNWVTSSTVAEDVTTVTTTQAKAWKFIDTPTGLSIDVNSVKVYVTDNGTEKEITSTITDKAVDNGTGVLSFTIPWIDTNGNSLYQPKIAGDGEAQTALIPVKVTYSATVAAGAATAAASNTVDVKYTNSEDNDISIGTSTVNTYTYKFQLNKSKADYTELTGAKFQIFAGTTIADGATPVKFTMNDGKYQLDPNGTVDTIDLTNTASATIIGLDQADYTLRETAVPDGYNQAADQTVASTLLKRVDEDITDADDAITGDDGVVTVINKEGAVLPSTGGMGTTLFYVLGGLMAVGALVILVTNKRMRA